MNRTKLNIGCGRDLRSAEDGWINLDMSEYVGADIICNIERESIPIKDNYCTEMYMSHVLEHIREPLPVMQELHRIAAPDCKLIVRVPYGASDIAFEDPTHYRQYFSNSFAYFGQPAYARADYGYRGDWAEVKRTFVLSESIQRFPQPESPEELMEMVRLYRNLTEELVVELRAVHPIREVTTKPDRVQIDFALPQHGAAND